jgi:hypothetical protein
MHPGYMWYRKQRQGRGQAYGGTCGPTYASAWCEAGTGASDTEWTFHSSSRGSGDPVFGSSGFGVRRPIRFLSERLDLSEQQVSELARIIERIRIERAQAAVDLRRAADEFADVLESGDFTTEAAESAGQRRIAAAKNVQDVVSSSLRLLHEMLDEEQRDELASLIRTGAIKL